jgi:hypothetical protein
MNLSIYDLPARQEKILQGNIHFVVPEPPPSAVHPLLVESIIPFTQL